MRVETDSMGEVEVAENAYWGAQTQRSIDKFPAGDPWPAEVVAALGLLKGVCAEVNSEVGWLDASLSEAIGLAASDVCNGQLDAHFPARVFQTGSGTHSNMNANEVIANRANELLGQPLGTKSPVHPNDHVNLGQSSNDVFPTVMHLAVVPLVAHRLVPALANLRDTSASKSQQWLQVVKTGRTHLQDAAPLTLGQEVSGWVAQLNDVIAHIEHHNRGLLPLAIGGTAVGTGLNSHPEFSARVCARLAERTGLAFKPASNRFAALAAHDAIVALSAALRTGAVALMKIANDVRWLASGPLCGIGELTLPANEPGSSIMPGKVNPTQCEALTQVCVQVFGNDAAVAFAGSQGNFELNVYKPVILHNVLSSVTLLTQAVTAFDQFCVSGMDANLDKIEADLQRNPMLATALNPHIGYEKSSAIVKHALDNQTTLKAAALALEFATEEQFDQWVQPLKMT